jgi:hypothetical protein
MHLMFLSAINAIHWDLGIRSTPFRAAPGHPNEALFQRGRSILNMLTSYYSISHHHLADHLIHLSSSSSFWFSLNSSYDYEFHLSKRLGMSPQDYEYLLMALDLARMDKRWGFSIMVMKWKVFLEGYLFSTINCDCDGTFEVDRKKMDIDAFIQGESSNKRKDIAFIRIGVLQKN